jgi:hypothetical protein
MMTSVSAAQSKQSPVILDCPRVRIPWPSVADLSTMLGGKAETIHKKAVLHFAEASQRFHSSKPRQPQRQNPKQMAHTGP